jgi:hypothetical protein
MTQEYVTATLTRLCSHSQWHKQCKGARCTSSGHNTLLVVANKTTTTRARYCAPPSSTILKGLLLL